MKKIVLPLVIGLAFAASPGRAVVLEQKFRAGETLNYQTALDGTLNVQLPADIPFILAGIPLDVEISGTGQTKVETLRVDKSGTGTLRFDSPRAEVQAQAMGQKFKWTLAAGQSQLSLNGKPLSLPKDSALPQIPATAVLVGKDGQLRGIQKLETRESSKTNQPTTKPLPLESAIDQSALLSATILKALPALWPQKDVQPGEKWQRTVQFPGAAKNDTAGAPLPLGQFEMTLRERETSGLWRVALVGSLDVDGTKLDSAPLKKDEKERPRLQSATQKVNGDVWFDAEKGQIARAELALDSNLQAATPAPTGKKSEPSWFAFTGTLQVQRTASAS